MHNKKIFAEAGGSAWFPVRTLLMFALGLAATVLLPSLVVAGRQGEDVPVAAPSEPGGEAPAAAASAPTANARPSQDFSGTVQAQQSGRLRLVTDLGSVAIHTHDSPTVDYHAHLEISSQAGDASRLLKSFEVSAREMPQGVTVRGHALSHAQATAGRLWVTLDVRVPRNYSLDISTASGNITTDDVNGRVTLLTQGGNIVAGNVNGPARLVAVAGGHITVKNVANELVAETGGGHITTGRVGGDATLHTSGGHIRSESIAGSARLATGGGNITLEHAGADLVADTNGGQIQVGEAAGLVHAKTDGGGIRLVRASGAATLESADGSIYLTQMDGSVKASTETGGITAWFVTPSKSAGESELDSSNGDIVVYLSRATPVTIDAQVQMGQSHGFVVDPAFPIKISYDERPGGERVARAEGMLNGGGEVLRLRTIAGNIRLVRTDLTEQMHMYRQQMEVLAKQMEQLQSMFQPSQQMNIDPRQP